MKKGIILMPYVSGRGGTETVVHNLFSILNDDNKISIRLLSIGGTSDYGWLNGVPYDMVKISDHYKINENKVIRSIFYSSVLPIYLFRYINKYKPDFIISTNPVMWFLAKKITNYLKLRIPIIAWYHYSLKQHPIKEKFLTSADYYFAISSGIKQQLISLGINENKIYLIYNPVESDYRTLRRPKKKTNFIYVGRVMLNGQKNCKELFKALSMVNGEWVLHVYGGIFKNEKYKNDINKFIDALGIKNKIIFHGFANDPWAIIKNPSALILTSKFEGLPMVLCEAISHGVYSISSDIETGPEDIINEKNGKLYELGNTDQLSCILQNIVDEGTDLPSEKVIQSTSKKFNIKNYEQYFTNSLLDIIS